MKIIVYNVSKAKNSAGIRVMNYLAYYIKELGYETYVTNPSWDEFNIPVFKGNIEDTDIVIYPEVALHNPLKAKNVAVYTLFYINSDINSNYFVFNYLPEFEANIKEHYRGNVYNMCLGHIEPDLFKPTEVKDIEAAMYIGKGTYNFPCPQVPPLLHVITSTFPPTRDATANFLSRLKYLFCYDFCTALVPEALLSGCKVFLCNKQGLFLPNQETEIYIARKERDMQQVKLLMKQILDFFHL